MDGFFLAQQGSGSGTSSLVGLLPIFLIILIFYFIMYRPIRQRQKNLEAMIASLSRGDRVITTGGIYGTVAAVKDHSVMLRINDQVKIEVAKNGIASMQTGPDESGQT